MNTMITRMMLCFEQPLINPKTSLREQSHQTKDKLNRGPLKCSLLLSKGNNKNIYIHLPFVHAPSKLTMFLCSPIWIRIFSSDNKSLYSASVALSVD